MKRHFYHTNKIGIKIAVSITVLFCVHAMAGAPITNEFWIAPNPTANFYPAAAGTIDNPLDGSTYENFDANINNLPPRSTIHVLAGTYQTTGVEAQSFQKIIGSGTDVTILQMLPNLGASGPGEAFAIMNKNNAAVTNVEVSDMTLDCNITNTTGTIGGIELVGTENVVRRVNVIHAGGFNPSANSETWAIQLCNYSLPDSIGNIIEGCKVSEYLGGPLNESALYLEGGGTNVDQLYVISGIIRDNTVIANEPGFSGNVNAICFGNRNSLVEGNRVQGATNVFHTETPCTNILIMHNFFDYCTNVIEFKATGSCNINFSYNNVVMPVNGGGSVIKLGSSTTNVMIFGNTVSFPDYNGTQTNWFLNASDVTGLIVGDNTVDYSLYNSAVNCVNANMYDNFDLFGNPLPGMNSPASGGNIYLPVSSDPSGFTQGTIYSGSDPILIATTNNFFAGQYAGNYTTTNSGDTAVGNRSGSYMTGFGNSAFGYKAMLGSSGASSGSDDSAFGASSQQQMTSGSENTSMGVETLFAAKTVNESTAVGYDALVNITSGDGNTAVGDNALYSCVTNDGLDPNTAVGSFTLSSLVSGGNDIAVGYGAGFWLTNGNNNIYIGNRGTQGDNNVIRIGTPGTQTNTYIAGAVTAATFIGDGGGLTGVTPQQIGAASATNATIWNSLTVGGTTMVSTGLVLSENIYLPFSTSSAGVIYSGPSPILIALSNLDFFLGPNAGNFSVLGAGDTAVGQSAETHVAGNGNSAFGYYAMNGSSGSTSGQYNSAFGVSSQQQMTSGSYNTSMGVQSLFTAATVSESTAVGYNTLVNIISGDGNTAVGDNALYSCVNNDAQNPNTAVGSFTLSSLISGGNDIAIGYGAGFSPTNGNNNIYIGNGGTQGDNNVIRIGTGQTDTFIPGTLHLSSNLLSSGNIGAGGYMSITNASSTNWALMSVTPSNAVISVQGMTVAILETNGILNAYNGLSTTVSNTQPASVVSLTGTGVAWTNTTPWNIVAYVSGSVMANVYYNGSSVFANVSTTTIMLKPGAIFSATNIYQSMNLTFDWHPF